MGLHPRHKGQQPRPLLGELEPEPDGNGPTPLIITRGDLGQNQRVASDNGITVPMLVQQYDEVAQLYRAAGRLPATANRRRNRRLS